MVVNFDKGATTRPKLGVISEIMPYLTEEYGNPSSNYKLGQKCKKVIDDTKEIIANYINCKSSNIVFTASSSESNNAVIQGIVRNNRDINIISTRIEHIDIIECLNYLEQNELNTKIKYCEVDNNCQINLEQLEKYCKSYNNSLVIVQFVNNELGTIQDVKKICDIAHKYNCIVFSDATQAITKTDINIDNMGIDILSFGSHKIHGIRGASALYINDNIDLIPLVFGHQNKVVAGTENTAAIVSIGASLKLEDNNFKTKIVRDYFEKKILEEIPNTYINGCIENRVFTVSNVCFKGYDAQSLQIMLDMYDIYVSTGSACNTETVEPSHVLKEIGMKSPDIYSCIRFSFDDENTIEEVDFVIEKIKDCLDSLDYLNAMS